MGMLGRKDKGNADADFDSKIAEFRGALKIDRRSLDEAVEQHAELYLRVQEAYVFAKSIRDERRTAMDEVYAEQSESARKQLSKSGEKWTESQVKDWVAVSKEYLDAQANYQETSKRAELLGVMVAAYEQRGKMLRELAQLFIAGYFTLNAVRGAQHAASDAAAKLGREGMASARGSRPAIGRKS